MNRIAHYILLLWSFFAVDSLNAQEALIPMPLNVQWSENKLDLSKGVHLEIDKSIEKNEVSLLKNILESQSISISKNKKLPSISLKMVSSLEIGSDEGYELNIDAKGIHIQALASKGIFYALQTLVQMDFHEKQVAFVNIKDQPAYSFRGFLLDVGRNYQPMSMLKEQIDVMAKYKLNVLHFHFTEDIAWRLESKKYPGLTAAENMTRWAGKYYTVAEFHELIDYCRDRHILFLPEIDMPGHSAAFERFFKVNMQSEEGIVYIKELLKEFAETFPTLKQLHIGGDEVKISNEQFMPEITKYVESLGFKTYGWDPGSNLDPSTVRQMWMGGPKAIDPDTKLQYLDSKHLYINHMDPLETVTTLFFRRFAEQEKESLQLPGAILCSWPDRAVEKPEDMFLQSAVYPGMITFAERIWRGGGELGWKAFLPERKTEAFHEFAAFEKRLLSHKSKYFANLPFPYQRQTEMSWDMIGPYDNAGDLTKEFPIEKDPFSDQFAVYKNQVGGTIVLRHWWADIIPGVIDSPKPNSTFLCEI
ncbi:family 20 glycosylhydrolase [Sphingobacterium mizutaii]|uniref:family 20 glycosylhydrolase n=1 Tax=Sphingobacterium mizutaii TaxID=1010 RepID=UPI003D968071